MTLTCIAVDDEPLALGLVCTFIEKTPFLRLAGRYSSAVEALQSLIQERIDVIFLDIQMPDLTGLELARVLERSTLGPNTTRIIFTTAFDQFALDGFRVDALDYLLKPFNYEEFLRAASKARHYFELVQRREPTPLALPLAVPAEPAEDYLFLKVEYQLVRVAYSDILYIEGLKDYVKVYRQSEPARPLLSLTSLKLLEEKLPARQFMRVHRSFIIALDQISAVTRNSVQINDTTIPVIFQALNNIYALTLLDVETAREALHRLSRMMRYVLYETQTGTTLLSKELSFVNDYIQLMQLRLTDKVTVTLNTPNPIHDQPIAPMLLLPFVENAFKHGVSAVHPSRIHITVQQQQHKLLLDVGNTVFTDKIPSLEAGNGIGLTNTRRRLDLLYPGQYALHIDEHTPAGEYHVHLTLDLS